MNAIKKSIVALMLGAFVFAVSPVTFGATKAPVVEHSLNVKHKHGKKHVVKKPHAAKKVAHKAKKHHAPKKHA